jgi:hypothetical protein
VCPRVKPLGFRTKCALGKKCVELCGGVGVGVGVGVGWRRVLISLFSGQPGETMSKTVSCSASEVFCLAVCSKILSCLGRREFKLKRMLAPHAL